MANNCLCHVRGDFEIVYCPLHEAAPELLKLAKESLKWFEWWVERTGASEPPQQSVEVLRRLRAALNPDLQKEGQ